ncbi:paralemmin-3 isoform X2 [Pseudophryne corroboree]
MGETQIYSQRLHGINEKRRILSEVDRIQRELEQQRLKLQQLKRKSLRDRWLMDGLSPAPGVELENPLSPTEDKIHSLEQELESLQLQLVHLENPELNSTKAKTVQETTLHKELVNGANGDRNQEGANQKENHEENLIIKDDEPRHNSHDETPERELTDPSLKETAQGEHGLVGQPIPAPRGRKSQKNDKVEDNLHVELSEPNELDERRKLEHFDQASEANNPEPLKQKEEHKKQNLNHIDEHHDKKAGNLDKGMQPEDPSLDQEHMANNKDPHNQNLECLDNSLEHERQNSEHCTRELGHLDINASTEDHKVDISQPSLSNEDISSVTVDQHQNDHAALLGDHTNPEILENQKDIQNGTPSISPTPEPPPDHSLQLTTGDHKNEQNLDEKEVSGSVIHDQSQDQNEEFIIAVLPGTQDNTVVLLTGQGKDDDSTQPVEDPNKNPSLPFNDQNLGSSSLPIYKDQSPVPPSEDRDKITTLLSQHQDPSTLLPGEHQNQAGQIHISQVVVIHDSAHDQHCSNQQPGTSASHRPGAVATNTPAECQPLLHKAQEVDDRQHPHGTNTAETRDKDTPVKKKTCQCCVVM